MRRWSVDDDLRKGRKRPVVDVIKKFDMKSTFPQYKEIENNLIPF